MLVNLSNIFTRDETEKQLSAEFDFSAENVSYDATFEKNNKKRYRIDYTGAADNLFTPAPTGKVIAQINNKQGGI